MIIVMGHFRIPAERLGEARPVMARVIAATLLEAGCHDYSYAESVAEPGLIRVSEIWETREHLDAHFASDHMAAWQIERSGLGLSHRHIVSYEVSSSEQI